MEGNPTLSGSVVLKRGAGVTLTQSGQEITIAADAGSTISGVYQEEANLGPVNIELISGSDLYFNNQLGQEVASFQQEFSRFNRPINLSSSSSIVADDLLDIQAGSGFSVATSAGDIDLNPAGQLRAKGLSILPSSVPLQSELPAYYSDNLLQTVLNEIEGNYIPFKNTTNEIIKAGTPITIDSDKVGFEPSSAWSPLTNAQIISDEIWLSSCFGVVTQDTGIGENGFAKVNGVVKANIGRVKPTDETNIEGFFQINDVLYIAPSGYAEIEFTSQLSNGNSVTIDGVTFTVGANGAVQRQFPLGANVTATLDNFIQLINNKEAKRDDYVGKTFRAISDGISASGDIFLSDNLVVGDTFTINAVSAGGRSATFTAVAAGTKANVFQVEVATSVAGTALNLFEAIRSTSRALPGDTNGHLCEPTLVGSTVRLKTREKGTAGNLISLAANNTRIQRPANLSGGRLWANVYFFSRISTGKLVSKIGNNIRVSNFTTEESESYYMPARLLFAEDRNPNYDSKIIKVGKVIDIQGEYPEATTSIIVEIEDIDVY
jgi:hypothetical protein